ncbi:MAG: acetyl/propionyl/methylcrotonyl-CoA carboxylase subunit alpha [Gammaproteobacteria bacterium]
MFKRIVIANRGEIACRIIRTAQKLGMQTIAIYAPNDSGALHTRLADIALPLPAGGASIPYLDIAAIVDIAKQTGAQAVHPGCGFLSENPAFAAACLNAGFAFVGPPPQVMQVAASKIRARQLAQKAGVHILPGLPVNIKSGGGIIADTIGYPLMLKAAAGGGGRGMRIVANAAEMQTMLKSAQREAKNAFGDGALLAEKYLPKARHLEVQILADKNKTIHTLGERDCSMQRRHQKILEESPAPSLSEKQRQELHSCALKIARAAKYENAGTAEFLLDEDSGKLYFLEINARLQVEHPLTEELFGIDLVEWQLRIAAGELLPATLTPPEDAPKWAMEARICAENPLRKLMPAAGVITTYHMPKLPGIRTDSGICAGEVVGGEYDSMLVKIIATGASRQQTRKRLLSALAKTRIDGIATNTAFIAALAESAPFAAGATFTASAENVYDDALVIVRKRRRRAAFLTAAYFAIKAPCPAAGFRLNDTCRRAFVVLRDDDECYRCRLQMDGDECRIDDDNGAMVLKNCRICHGGIGAQITEIADETDDGKSGGGNAFAECDIAADDVVNVFCGGISLTFRLGELPIANDMAAADGKSGGIVIAPMSGIVREVMAQSGDVVCGGDGIIVMEAMKMDIVIEAPHDGIVKTMECAAGNVVSAGAVLARINNKDGKSENNK